MLAISEASALCPHGTSGTWWWLDVALYEDDEQVEHHEQQQHQQRQVNQHQLYHQQYQPHQHNQQQQQLQQQQQPGAIGIPEYSVDTYTPADYPHFNPGSWKNEFPTGSSQQEYDNIHSRASLRLANDRQVEYLGNHDNVWGTRQPMHGEMGASHQEISGNLNDPKLGKMKRQKRSLQNPQSTPSISRPDEDKILNVTVSYQEKGSLEEDEENLELVKMEDVKVTCSERQPSYASDTPT